MDLAHPRRRTSYLESAPARSEAPTRVLLDAGVEVAAFVDGDERKIGTRIYGFPSRARRRSRGGVVLGAVAGDAARTRLRALAREQGRREGYDFVVVT